MIIRTQDSEFDIPNHIVDYLTDLTPDMFSTVIETIKDHRLIMRSETAWEVFGKEIRKIRDQHNMKIFAIKTVRRLTGMGLKEAKEFVDNL